MQFDHQTVYGIVVASDRPADLSCRKLLFDAALPNAPRHFLQPRVRPPD